MAVLPLIPRSKPSVAERWQEMLSRSSGNPAASMSSLASRHSHRAAAQALMGSTPDLNAVAWDGHSLLFHALSSTNGWIALLLVKKGVRPLPHERVLGLILRNAPKCWAPFQLLARGLDQDELAAEGSDLIHLAAARPKPLATRDLLRAGVDANAPNAAGFSPLHSTLTGNLTEPGSASRTLDELTAAGADWLAVTPEGWSLFQVLLTHAARLRPPVGLVVPASADRPDPDGWTPLTRVVDAYAQTLGLFERGVASGPPPDPSAWLQVLRGAGMRWDTPNADGSTAGTRFDASAPELFKAIEHWPEAKAILEHWCLVRQLDKGLPITPTPRARQRM